MAPYPTTFCAPILQPIHRTIHKLSQTYGSIMSLRFGALNVLVISTPSAVEECLVKKNAKMPLMLAGKYLNYDYKSMASIFL
ncbi:isoflavone 2'-hydroxylase-like [Senna tora]|uniref:Isoflavone 2'-hydroxylase-like n=1 Tax=Senna tora TaxID=362788 RepID=A0A834SIW6_9FABA|nr:isoflavone 2'-hydroxylase-like [Senna tora]